MPSYTPTSLTVLLGIAMAACTSLAIGYRLQQSKNRWLAWLWFAGGILATDQFLADEGDGLRMLALVACMLYAMKAIVGVERCRRHEAPLTLRNWLLFSAVWLGMQPCEFAVRRPPLPSSRGFATSIVWCASGIATIGTARALFASHGTSHQRALSFLVLLGCSMVLHFGLIGIVAAALQRIGYRVTPQFRAPWCATSLQDFWARRWNIGFSVMTSIAIYRPMRAVVGRTSALFAGFLASGVLHELACSLPVGGGYGRPTIYFALHAIAIAIEQWLARRGTPLNGIWARAWVFAWVLLPAPLVFHDAFLRGIALPLLTAS